MKDWTIKNGLLQKSFELKSFTTIIDKLPSLAKVADRLNHHPDFEVKDYNTIIFYLCTHDQNNTITEKDWELSREIDLIFK
jgi:4a-hydroxytetrahydrobiopterin dehydratase